MIELVGSHTLCSTDLTLEGPIFRKYLDPIVIGVGYVNFVLVIDGNSLWKGELAVRSSVGADRLFIRSFTAESLDPVIEFICDIVTIILVDGNFPRESEPQDCLLLFPSSSGS